MPPRRARYTTDQTAIDFDAPAPELVEPLSRDGVAERAAPEYTTAPKWVDITGKTRTWVLRDPEGGHVAEVTTKRDAHKLAALLNRVTGSGRGQSR